MESGVDEDRRTDLPGRPSVTIRTFAATNARPDPNNSIPTILVPDGTCLATDDGDTSYAESYPGQATGSLALVGGAVLWTPTASARFTRIDSAQIVVVARYVSGSDVRLQAGWTDPAFLTNNRAYGAFTGPALTSGYATYTAAVPTAGMLESGGPDLSGIVGYCAVDDLAADSARFTYASLIVTGITGIPPLPGEAR
jgi:hypothetical protein